MSENRESGPSVTGVLPNTTSFVQRANDVLSQNISDVEKEQLLRQLLGGQVTGDNYTVPPIETPSGKQVGNENQQSNVGKQHYRKDGKPRHHRNPRDEHNEWKRPRGRHEGRHVERHGVTHDFFQHDVPNFTMREIMEPFNAIERSVFDPLISHPFDNLMQKPFGRGRRFIGPFDLMEPAFFGSSRLQHDVGRMFDDQHINELEQECKLDDEESKHLKFTSKLVSIGSDGIKRTRVVNGVTKIGKDGKPMTHKKMISSDDTGKTITEVFADGTERTTKRPFIKGNEHEEDTD